MTGFFTQHISFFNVPIVAAPLLIGMSFFCILLLILSLSIKSPKARELAKLLVGGLIVCTLFLYGQQIIMSTEPARVFSMGDFSMENKIKVWGNYFESPLFIWNSILWGTLVTTFLFLRGLFFVNPLKRLFLDKSYRVKEKERSPADKASIFFDNPTLLKRLKHSNTGLPLGKHPSNKRKIIYYKPDEDNGLREGHHIVVAGSRGGKTTGCIIPAVMDWQGPLFVIDVKREIFPQTISHRQSLERQVVVLDPFGEGPTDYWNPLDAIRKDYVTEDARVISESLIEEESSVNKHFSDSARMLLATAIEVHIREGLDPRTLKGVLDVLLGTDLGKTLDRWKKSSVDSARQHALTLGKVFESKSGEGASFLTTLARSLSWLLLKRMENLTSRSTFSLKEILHNNLDIFLAIPTGQVMQTRGFIRLVTNQVIRTISNASGIENVQENVLVVLDEAPVLGHLDSVKEAFTLGAGWGMSALLVTQNIGQLSRIWKEDLGTFFENAATIRAFNLGLGEKNKGTAEFIAALLPEVLQVKRSSTNKTSGRILGIPDSETVSSEMKPALKGEEIIRLKRDQIILLVRGEKPLTLQLIESWKDKYYLKNLKENPTRKEKKKPRVKIWEP